MQDSGLHDQGEMLALVAQQREVFARIAVDQDGVGKGTCLQCAQLAGRRNTLIADALRPSRRAAPAALPALSKDSGPRQS